MDEKIIEIHHKYTIPSPKKLFDMLCAKLSSLEPLPYFWDNKAWTETVLGAFNSIGLELGYIPRREYLRLDQTWEVREHNISTIVLAFEHEATDTLANILDDELQKLMDMKAHLKVLFFYPGIPAVMVDDIFTFPEIVRKICLAEFKNPDERYVIITGVLISEEERRVEISACSLDPEGTGEELGSIEVKFLAKVTS